MLLLEHFSVHTYHTYWLLDRSMVPLQRLKGFRQSLIKTRNLTSDSTMSEVARAGWGHAVGSQVGCAQWAPYVPAGALRDAITTEGKLEPRRWPRCEPFVYGFCPLINTCNENRNHSVTAMMRKEVYALLGVTFDIRLSSVALRSCWLWLGVPQRRCIWTRACCDQHLTCGSMNAPPSCMHGRPNTLHRGPTCAISNSGHYAPTGTRE